MARRKTGGGARLYKTRVKDIMTDYVECVRAGATVKEAAGRMRAFDLGFLPVCNDRDMTGILTDRDIVMRVTAEGRDAAHVQVNEVMTREIVFCWGEQSVEEAGRIMQMNLVRRLVVVSEDGRLQGVLTLADLTRNGFEELAARVLNATVQAIQIVPSLSSFP